ncbi:MAG: hypothetical protein ACOCX9_01430 [Spirochaetota bacterium]
MSFFNEARDSIMKYSEKFVNKTEEYAKIGKITMDIKKMENSIEKAYTELGKIVFEKISHGASEIKADEDSINQQVKDVQSYNKTIDEKRKEIEDIKKQYRGTNDGQSNQQSHSEKKSTSTGNESADETDKSSK